METFILLYPYWRQNTYIHPDKSGMLQKFKLGNK